MFPLEYDHHLNKWTELTLDQSVRALVRSPGELETFMNRPEQVMLPHLLSKALLAAEEQPALPEWEISRLTSEQLFPMSDVSSDWLFQCCSCLSNVQATGKGK